MPVTRKTIAVTMSSLRCSNEPTGARSAEKGTLVIWWVNRIKSSSFTLVDGQRMPIFKSLSYLDGVRGITSRVFRESRRLFFERQQCTGKCLLIPESGSRRE